MNQTVNTAEWSALEASHNAAHADAKQIPLSILIEHRAAIEQASGEMASGVRACTQAEAPQA